jgi:hypothetical protein
MIAVGLADRMVGITPWNMKMKWDIWYKRYRIVEVGRWEVIITWP